MITMNASDKIRKFNERGLHYNIVADAVYRFRNSKLDHFNNEYLPYIIAALISFDMGRMMGSNADGRHDTKRKGFANHLLKKLNMIKPYIAHLMNLQIDDFSLSSEKENIKMAYGILSAGGKDGLNQKQGEFHVGTTKILHFMNPMLFIIVDSNAARAFKLSHRINFRNTTQPGYSRDKYIECMEHARMDILNFGVEGFCALDKGVPIARIYDKLTFMTGSKKP
jgi:hypothetical protein